MFERYIHTNSCNDEGGWFAYFCPDGNATTAFDEAQKSGLYTNGWETEEQAVKQLIRIACGMEPRRITDLPNG